MTGLVLDWTVLKCDCKGDLFLPLVRLKYRDGGGTTTEPAGHKCGACGAVVDNAYMIKLIEIQRKRDSRARLDAEIAEAEAATRPAPPKGPAPVGRP